MLAAMGAGGLAGLAGCGSPEQGEGTDADGEDGSGAPSGDIAGPSVEDDGSPVVDDVASLDFGTNLDAGADGNRARIDARPSVEVVDSEGQTALASTIEVGPGLDVSVDGDRVTVSRSAPPVERVDDGAYVGRPGDLQSALDDAAEDGVGRVRLASGAVYERDASIVVPPGLVLDCGGARIELTGDVDGFVLHTRSQVTHPHVRTTGVDGYSSSVFHVYPEAFEADFGAPVPVWSVFGGWSEMTPGEGTCIDIHGSETNPGSRWDPDHEWHVYFCHVAHNCAGGRRYAHLHREGGDANLGGHVNGNVIQGFARGATRFVVTDDDVGAADNMVNGNRFNLSTQPGDQSEWLWYARKGLQNELTIRGQHWDYHHYTDYDGDGHEDWWYIGPHAGMNFMWRNRMGANGGLGAAVVDDSDGASGSRYLVHERLGVPVEDLPVWDGAE